VEAVARRKHHDIDVLVVLLQHRAEALDVLGLGILVLLAVEPEEGHLDVLGDVEAGDRAVLARIGPCRWPIPRGRRLDVGKRSGDLDRGGATPAPAGHADTVGADTRARLGEVDRRLGVAQHLLTRHGQDDLQNFLDVRHVADAALALEQLGRDSVVALLGESPGRVANVFMDAPDLRDHKEDRGVAARRRARLVHRQLVATDRNLGLAGHQALGVGRDRVGQRAVGSHGVAREGHAAGLEHLAPRQ